jgi:hypothetical protein
MFSFVMSQNSGGVCSTGTPAHLRASASSIE